MHRRTFMGAVGSGVVATMAGCTSFVLGDPADDLEVDLASVRSYDYSIHAEGEVINTSESPVKDVVLTIVFLNREGKQIAHTTVKTPYIGAKTEFSFNTVYMGREVPDVESYDTDVSAERA